jgi:hypothetical protein
LKDKRRTKVAQAEENKPKKPKNKNKNGGKKGSYVQAHG